jgi:multiple sugar transport system permease protein
MRAAAPASRAPRAQRRNEALAAFVFILPWIIGFIVLTAGPMIASVYLSLTNYNVLQPPRWIGFANYQQILTSDDLFRKSLLNTFYYTAIYVPTHMAAALGLALLLNAKVRGVPFWRTFFYLPSITPVVAVAVLWRWILNPNGGAINQGLSAIGIPGPGWTTAPNWMIPLIVLMTTWTGGGAMLIYLAGLKNIPRELYEAAEIDGAGAVARFMHITLPMLFSVLFFTAVIGIIAALQTFAQPVVLFDENGGSGNAALFYIMHLFNQAFAYFKMGYASALAWIIFVIIVAFTVLQFRLSNRWVYYEGGER